jgi:hypothetical protein
LTRRDLLNVGHCARGRRWLEEIVSGHPVHRYRTPSDISGFVPRNAGFSRVYTSLRTGLCETKSQFYPPVSASKNSVPDSSVREGSMTGRGVGSSVPSVSSSPSKPQSFGPPLDSPFQRGFSPVLFRSFGLCGH